MSNFMEIFSEKISQKKKKKIKVVNLDGFSFIINIVSVYSKFFNFIYEDGNKIIIDKIMKKGLYEKGKFCKNSGVRFVVSVLDISFEEDDLESIMKVDDEVRVVLFLSLDFFQMMNLVVRIFIQVFFKVKYYL